MHRDTFKTTLGALAAVACAAAHASTIINVEAANPSGTLVQLAAGTYELSYVGIAQGGQYDAWTAWAPGAFCSIDPQGNAVPCPTGFISMFRMEGVDPDLVVAPDGAKGVNTDLSYGPVRTYMGFFDIKVTPLEALQDAQARLPSFSLTMASPGAVRFLAGENPAFGCVTGVDSGCWSDNSGGVSLLLSAVPEADPRLLLAAGLAGIGLVARRRRRA